jgi:hypothetical protein
LTYSHQVNHPHEKDKPLIVLPIYISHRSISIIESALSCAFQAIPRAQMWEAIASGLHLTDGSELREALAERPARPVATDGQAFIVHLARCGHDVPAAAFFAAGALSALDMVSRFLPLLGRAGFGPFADQRTFAQDRAELVGPVGVPGFLQAMRFIQGLPSAASAPPAASSYALKHLAERQDGVWSDGRRAGPSYVANGEMIAAGMYSGRKWAHENPGSPNILFDVDLRKLERAERKAMRTSACCA